MAQDGELQPPVDRNEGAAGVAGRNAQERGDLGVDRGGIGKTLRMRGGGEGREGERCMDRNGSSSDILRGIALFG